MFLTKTVSALLLTAVLCILLGCQQEAKSPDVTDSVRHSLDQAGLKDVNVSQDRDKGVVTLSGITTSDTEKAQAESIARSIASSEVIANQIAVRPPGEESTTKDVDSALDKAIEKNLDAQLIQRKWNHDIKYDVKNGVVTLKGEVNSEGKRSMAEKVAASVPNVKQVVNEIEVKNRKASSSSSSR
ncbi:MAG TPA: BON domain-containing protein [Candidatus Acidoferrum sp.]|jgi:osmotically-inducible protein OsmY